MRKTLISLLHFCQFATFACILASKYWMKGNFEETYKALVRRYYTGLLFYATRLVGEDDAEDIVLGSVHAQTYIIGKDEGTDVQGSTIGTGHPVALHAHQSLNSLHKILFRDLGDAQTVGRILKTLGVAVRAEQLHGVVGGAVGFHALKDLLCVVEHHGSGVQFKGAVGDDAGIVPALALGVVHNEHMVGELLAKTQLRLVLRLFLRAGSTSDLDVQHDKFPSFLISRSAARAARPAPNMPNVVFYYSSMRRNCKATQNLSCLGAVSCRKL